MQDTRLSPDRTELERVAQDFYTEATSENPEPGRLREFATQLNNAFMAPNTSPLKLPTTSSCWSV